MELSLREKKKSETKQAIYEAAVTLFRRNGYNETTLNDIARVANVSQRTIFSYYPSKEAIIFGNGHAFITSFISYIENRGGMTVIEAIRAFMHDNTTIQDSEEHSQVKGIIKKTPALQNYLSRQLTEIEKKIVIHIANEQHFKLNSIQAHMVAGSIRAIITYRLQYTTIDEETIAIALRYIEGGIQESTQQ